MTRVFPFQIIVHNGLKIEKTDLCELNNGGVLMKYFYGILSFFGVILPYSQFIPWVMHNGLNFPILFEAITRTRIGAFAWMDVLVTAIVLVGFIVVEGTRKRMKYLWMPIVGTLLVGPSLGFPLFLFLRQLHLEKK